jgi:hypothetical protein
MAIDINELIAEVVKHSHFDGETIELGNLISLHINEEGDCVDLYKWASREAMEADDYDFDSDYICTLNIGE